MACGSLLAASLVLEPAPAHRSAASADRDTGTERNPEPTAVITRRADCWPELVLTCQRPRAIPTVTVNDPSVYYLAFNADGTYSAQADCNNSGGVYPMAPI
jgi:heat shock protein HslJ